MKTHNHDQIAGSIIYIGARLESIANHYVFAPMGISSVSVKILGMLCCGRALSPSEILERLGGTKSNVSQRLNFLEKEGLIERTHANQDRRKVAIQLTKKGTERMNAIMERLTKAQISLESKFSKQELQQHRKFIEKINRILDEGECEIRKAFNE